MTRPARLALALLTTVAAFPLHADDTSIGTVLNRIQPKQIEATITKLVSFGTRHTLSETDSDTRGIGAARRWIKSEFERCNAERHGRLEVSFQSHIEPASKRIDRAVEIVNVVATLPGLDPQAKARVFVVSGHYDSRVTDVMNARSDAPGANDDASGTAAVMAMACAMADQPTDATIVFMAVAAEEQGLFGAEDFAKKAEASGMQIEGAITNDIIGSSTGDDGSRHEHTVRLFVDGLTPLLKKQLAESMPGDAFAERTRKQLAQIALIGGEHDTPTHQFGRAMKRAAERWQPDFTVDLIGRRDRFLRGGDHLPFLERGWPALRFTEPAEDFRHQHQDVRTENGVKYGDLPEFVDYAYVARVARANLAGLASLARAPSAPEDARMEVTQLTNDTTLTWQAPRYGKPVGYRLVWRATDSEVWQGQQDVPASQTKATLPLSKDNLQFGVIALGADGVESVAAFPLPEGR